MGLGATARNWGSTPAEREMVFPCDRYLHESGEALFRAIDVDAPASIVFRWLCQLRAAGCATRGCCAILL